MNVHPQKVVADGAGGLKIGADQTIPADCMSWSAIRAQGPGGQHVNKSSTAMQLRFDIRACDVLDDAQKDRLLALRDRRLSRDGVVTIKAQRFRSQDKNRADALERLGALLERGLEVRKPRKATRPGKGAKERRLKDKARRSTLKSLRRSPGD